MTSASHSTISSNTATPSTSRANRVCRIFKSLKIFETTGTDVTATPTARMMIIESRFPFGPSSDGLISIGANTSPSANGSPVPTTVSQPTSRRSSRVKSCWVSAPLRNISSSNPSQ